MSLFKTLGMAAQTHFGVKAIQTGSDVLINRHGPVNVFAVDKGLRTHADSLIAERFKNAAGEPINEFEAAMLKLAVFYATAEHYGDANSQALAAEAIAKIREAGGDKISAAVSLEVMGQTGA